MLVPEPTMFAGDPLKFVDFWMSFTILIDRKPISASEKMLYLKGYLSREARKAVEGFFYRSSEDAYEGAWAVLKDRYGNPFIVQKAFRDKLMKWPKISPNDSLALRDFADFLKSCEEAMPHVKGLAILNDFEENRKLLEKLPDWIVRKWSRIVVEQLDASGEYPIFEHFTKFVLKEARIACNPITSSVLSSSSVDEKFPKRAKALSTSAQTEYHAFNCDCPSALAPLEVITGGENEPFAQKTELGWSIIGAANPHLDRQGSQRFVHRVAVREMPVPSAADILKVLESDFIERNSEGKCVSQDDVRFIQILSENIQQKEDGHMPLPFKGQNPPSLPNNKKLAIIRLQHLKRKFKANQQFYGHYKAFMEDVINKGDAEPAPEVSVGDVVWYIPHHGVYHPKKPGKLRVVFDCSAKFCCISLNDTLLTGPDMIHSLVGVLFRFRKEKVICDIERMFHQFFVRPDNRSYLRFLWWEHGDLDREPKEYQMAVHLFGAASSPGCADFGLKYLAQQYKALYPSAAAFVENSFYVDDGLVSVPTVKEACELIVEAQELCKRGGLRLHKFNSNESEALHCVEASERVSRVKQLDLNPDSASIEYALGIQWLIESDSFSFNINLKDKPDTRRGILSVIASLNDPLGFVAPFVLSGKCILQELCRRSIGWDDLLPEDLLPRWEEWKAGLRGLKIVWIPRCYHPQDFGKIVSVELHHFADASSVGYGACSYLRCKDVKNKVHCSFVMAKARVAPSKITSIPRLELSAAVVAARMSVLLESELNIKIDEEFFWTDSQVTLAYINNEARRFHIFVANRVQLIREYTIPSQWFYVDTKENPADHASRGLRASDILSTTWLSGPEFLWKEEVHPEPTSSLDLLVGDPEVKTIQAFAIRVTDCTNMLDRLFRLSSWTTLLKVVARIKRLVSGRKCQTDVVTVKERESAAKAVIKLVQQQAFSQEIKALETRESLPCSSPLFSFDPILNPLRSTVSPAIPARFFYQCKRNS
ncbi:hypothetical protein PO909_014534 [Leuciscus waleckii]